jgi:hypothetical protein
MFKNTKSFDDVDSKLVKESAQLIDQVRKNCAEVSQLLVITSRNSIEIEAFTKIGEICSEYLELVEKQRKEKQSNGTPDRDKGSNMEDAFNRDLLNKLLSRG